MTDRVGNMGALELVRKIRIGDTSNMRDPWDVKQLTDAEAAALINGYGRRVLRKMLMEIENKAWCNGNNRICIDLNVDDIATKYGVS